MKVRIIEANGIKEFESVFNLEFLQQFMDKHNPDDTSTTGDYITTTGDSSTTGGFWPNSDTTISCADNIKYTNNSLYKFTNDSLVKFCISTS